ncbi:MAG: acetyl-CoA carboxylase biotin carboxyl carrier protein subunit [Bacteroidia bacterium]|nr:acetyl-CoA carboxylase biotin carboxyl carrier protein subunit [Bacteroidia bacterium]
MTEAHLQGEIFQIDQKGDDIILNGQEVSPEMLQKNEHIWQVIHHGRSYQVLIQKIDPENKTVTISLHGKTTEVKLRTRMEKLLTDLGMAQSLQKKLEVLKAPMPGLIHKIQVAVGDHVEKGQAILVLEAMKMENIIKAPGEGIVKEVLAKEGASVEKGSVLIRFE